jgi:hypothetical protein
MKERDNGKVELVSKMFEKYPDEWIFFEVVERDEHEHPWKGVLLLHGPDRGEVYERALEIRQKTPMKEVAVFFTGRVVPEGTIVWL